MSKPRAHQLNVIVGQAHWDITHAVVLPAGTSTIVTAIFAARTPGGTDAALGVYTTTPQNRILIRLRLTGKAVVDPISGDQIYARLTEAGGVWTLSFYTIGDAAYDFTGHPEQGSAFDLRWCESIQLSQSKPTAVVDFAEGIDEFMPESASLHNHVVEEKVVATPGQTAFTLTNTPKTGTEVKMFVNGIMYRNGTNYTVTGTSIAWTDLFTLITADIVTFVYEKAPV